MDSWESINIIENYSDSACPGPQASFFGWDLGLDGNLRNGRNGRSGKLNHSKDEIGVYIHVHIQYA